MRILVTGAAGFVGAAVVERLLERGQEVVGLDNLNPYYDVSLKEARLARLLAHRRFRFERLDLEDRAGMEALFAGERPERVVHLAAQAGVRYSLEHPHVYVSSNVVGFLHVLEGCRAAEVEHLVFASSSSVYGANTEMPFSEHQGVGHPLSLYAATKRANELMAHTYAHLHGLPVTGLRFFTVYGPWGRPDMSPFVFARRILDGEPIDVYHYGKHERDFTYVDDVAEGVVRCLDHPARPDPAWRGETPDPATSRAPFRIYNIGGNRPVPVIRFIELLEQNLGRSARKNLLPMQPGDVPATFASVDDLEAHIGFRPATSIEAGVARFVEWYKAYYRVEN